MAEGSIPKPDLNWLVPMRSRIQALGLEIYNFDSGLTEEVRERVWPIHGYLVGIVFSLWRSVFLSLPAREPSDMRDQARYLLRVVLETNSIGFPQDKLASQWMAGYYHNNAILRLFDLLGDSRARLVIEGVLPANLEVTALGWYRPDRQAEFGMKTPQEQCELSLDALEQLFSLLQRALGPPGT